MIKKKLHYILKDLKQCNVCVISQGFKPIIYFDLNQLYNYKDIMLKIIQ